MKPNGDGIFGLGRCKAGGPGLTPTFSLHSRDNNQRLVDSLSNDRVILHAVTPLLVMPGDSLSDAALERRMPHPVSACDDDGD